MKIFNVLFFLLISSLAGYAQVSDADLKKAADTIKNETTPGANTRFRIARMFNNIIDSKVSLSGSYSNPSWITGLAWSKISSTPTTISGYGISDGVTSSDLSAQLAGKQDIDGDLTAIAGLNPSNDDIIQRKSGAWTNRSMSQLRTDLALVVDAINDGQTTTAPSQNAVYDALALKLTLPSAPGSGQDGQSLRWDNGDGAWEYFTPGSGGGGEGAWGDITGTLSDQTDLQAALDSKQASDSDLTAIAGLSASNDDFLQRKSGAWTNRTLAQVRTDLALVTQAITNGTTGTAPSEDVVYDALQLKANLAGPTFTGTVVLPSTTSIGNVSNTELGYLDGVTSAIQTQFTGKQNSDSDLTTIAGLTHSSGAIIQSSGSAWTSTASPSFGSGATGTTASATDNDTSLATTAFAQSLVTLFESTGNDIVLDRARIYGKDTPATGNITYSTTNLKAGGYAVMRHNDDSEPTFESGMKIISGEYIPNTTNVIMFMAISSSSVWVSITQEP